MRIYGLKWPLAFRTHHGGYALCRKQVVCSLFLIWTLNSAEGYCQLVIKFKWNLHHFPQADGLDNGLVPNRRQAIILTNADPNHWRIYAALRGDELIVKLSPNDLRRMVKYTDLCVICSFIYSIIPRGSALAFLFCNDIHPSNVLC